MRRIDRAQMRSSVASCSTGKTLNHMATTNEIPFNKPFIIGKELYYIAQAVQAGYLAGDGSFSKRCHSWLEQRFGARKVLLTIPVPPH